MAHDHDLRSRSNSPNHALDDYPTTATKRSPKKKTSTGRPRGRPKAKKPWFTTRTFLILSLVFYLTLLHRLIYTANERIHKLQSALRGKNQEIINCEEFWHLKFREHMHREDRYPITPTEQVTKHIEVVETMVLN
ncbi:hypothetical protein EJ08DRAFT_696280 [Tothia fuscella]|uniref:Uncharacterized protein n=1 Tax=Tothia fuscella TaxID=1048955 RepID=A0A9P4U025_9PEZI|nr:hypothetical protein EJ08DRAFT_696280 [Tothia fuscella]